MSEESASRHPDTGGTIAAVHARACGVSSTLPFERQLALTAGAGMWSTVAVEGANIPALRMADGPMGIASRRIDERDVALLTPCPTALGASWDPELCERIGALVGREAVRNGIDMVLGPNVNLPRSPLAGRSFEYFSEDPLLTGACGSAWAKGVQSTGTAATVKHLVCNDSETGRDTMNVIVDERTLREVYLLPFEICADGGVAAIMAAYNRVNGRWSAEQHHVISIVKNEWGFEGPVMSDWFATHSTVSSLNAGLDLEMPGPGRFLGTAAAGAVAEGHVARDRIADAVERVAGVARRFGREKAYPTPDQDADALLLEAAANGFVLLRNEGQQLPLDPDAGGLLAVIGPNAVAPCFQGGTFAKIAVTPSVVSPLDAIRARFGSWQVEFETGAESSPRLPSMPARPARDLGDGASRGMTVDYYSAGSSPGTPSASETRDTNSLVWFAGIHDDVVRLQEPGRIVASGRFTAEVGGRHEFRLGGTGPLRLRVDGVEVYACDVRVPVADVMGVLKRGDTEGAEFVLVAGQTVLVEIELAFEPARAHGLWYGVRQPDDPDAKLGRAAALAARADAVLLFVGETSDASVESKDRADTELPADQLRLIDAVTRANPRTAIIANVGHAFDTRWENQAAALLLVWYPGQAFGPAIAAVLAGDREPGGRMPLTIARADADYPAFNLDPAGDGTLAYTEGVRIGYRGIADPRHPLGSGEGYATIEIVGADIDWREDGGATVSATLANRSARAGTQVVQVYRRLPELALVGFAKARLAPGQHLDVTIDIAARRLQIWQDGWRAIADPQLFVGCSATDITFELTGSR